MLFFLLSGVLAYTFSIEKGGASKKLIFRGIEDSIYTGNFELVESPGQSVTIRIYPSKRPKDRYFETVVTPESKQNFSFTLSKPEEFSVEMIKKNPSLDVKIGFTYDTQFNTFNKETAQKVVVKPAIMTLNNFGALLKKVSDQTYERARYMSKVRDEHRRAVLLVLFFSLLATIGFAVVNYYQVVMLKKFFKQKKLI